MTQKLTTKELGSKIRFLRGKLSLDEAAEQTGVSRESIRKIEAGKQTKASTLRQLLRGYKVSEGDYDELTIAWLRTMLGPDRDRFVITPKRKSPSAVRSRSQHLLDEIQANASKLSAAEQREIIKAMQHEGVLRSLRHINLLTESKPPTPK